MQISKNKPYSISIYNNTGENPKLKCIKESNDKIIKIKEIEGIKLEHAKIPITIGHICKKKMVNGKYYLVKNKTTNPSNEVKLLQQSGGKKPVKKTTTKKTTTKKTTTKKTSTKKTTTKKPVKRQLLKRQLLRNQLKRQQLKRQLLRNQQLKTSYKKIC